MTTATIPQAEKAVSAVFLKASALVFAMLVAAKALNFFKKILIGNLFGVSPISDAFFAASYLPCYVAIFFEGVFFLVFMPLFARVASQNSKEKSDQFIAEILLVTMVLTCLVTALAWWFAPWLMGQMVPGFSAAERALTCTLFRIMSVVIVFMSLTSFCKSLNSYFGHYGLAASATLVEAAGAIGVTVLSWKIWGIYGAAWGAVLGAFAACLLQTVPLLRMHRVLPRRWALTGTWVRPLVSMLIPLSVIWAFQQVPMVILNRFGSGMWQGTISSLSIALTLMSVPVWLVSHTVLCTIFPALARNAQDGDREACDTFFQTLRGAFFILIPLGFLITALSRPIAAFFFSGGGITEEGVGRIANSLAFVGWGTFGLYADLFMTQSLIALRKTRPAILLCGTRAVLMAVISYFLSNAWDYEGLALSFALALAINMLVFFPLFFPGSVFRRGWKDLFAYCGKLFLASSPFLPVLFFARQWKVAQWTAFPAAYSFFFMALASAGGAGLYFLFLHLIKVPEMRAVLERIRRGSRRDWSAAP